MMSGFSGRCYVSFRLQGGEIETNCWMKGSLAKLHIKIEGESHSSGCKISIFWDDSLELFPVISDNVMMVPNVFVVRD